MNIENMRAFLEIAACGSFQDAAERLHITQSAISARIKALESRFNRQLYIRRRRGVELTDAGRRLQHHAQSCVEARERAQQEISLPQEFDTLVSLGIQINFWDQLALPWSDWMLRHAPHLATRITSDYTERLLSLLRDGKLDLAVVYNARPGSHLIVEQLLEDDLILVSTEPRSLNTGWTPGYLFVDWAGDFQARHAAAYPESPPPRLSVSTPSVALRHILKHGGSAYFLHREIAGYLANGALHRVEDAAVFTHRSYLVYPRESPIQDSIDTAIEGVREVLMAG